MKTDQSNELYVLQNLLVSPGTSFSITADILSMLIIPNSHSCGRSSNGTSTFTDSCEGNINVINYL